MLNLQSLYDRPAVQRLLIARRRRRAKFVLSRVRLHPGMSVLDVGCGPDGNSLESFLPADYRITGIDLLEPARVRMTHPRFQYFKQDARDLSRFRDKEFDLAVSIGMMEHICDRVVLLKMAGEIDRVSRQYVIVVPWRYAWLEPHFKLPFFQLMPWPVQRKLVSAFNPQDLGSLASREPHSFKRHFEENYQWLSNRDWKTVFKDSRIYLNPTLETISIVKTDARDLVKATASGLTRVRSDL